MRKFASFAVTGGIGFAADAAFLAALTTGFGMEPLAARLISIAGAMALTWLVNRNFTFGASGSSMLAEGARYGGVSIAASALNYCAYALSLAAFPFLTPVGALAVGSAIAMAFSWTGYSRYVFR